MAEYANVTIMKKWYIAFLLFAQLPNDQKRSIKCESCKVLFEAESAIEVYDKSILWAEDYKANNLFKFVGVEHIHKIGDEYPKDGTEICGSLFDDENIWERKDELIPKKHKLTEIIWEQNQNISLKELMTKSQIQNLKDIFCK
jgi:hypothetical protein